MDYQFKVGDKGKTRGGRDYRVICVDGKLLGGYSVVALVEDDNKKWDSVNAYRENGAHMVFSVLDLLPPRQKRKVWVNVHRDAYAAWPSKALADGDVYSAGRIACVEVEIEFTPGEGL